MTPAGWTYRCWVALSLLASTACVRAVSTDSKWALHVWQSDDGLPNNNVTSIAQTPDGYLWVANPFQLVRFDGVQFEAFSPTAFGANPNLGVHVLLKSSDRGLWLAMDHGAVAYLKSGQARIYTNGLPDLSAQKLTESNHGVLWVTYNRGVVYQLLPGANACVTEQTGMPPGPACSLVNDGQGRLWFAKSGQGDAHVGLYRDGRFQTLLRLGPEIVRLAAARAGGVWVCSGNQLFKYNEGASLEERGAFSPERAGTRPKVVLEDSRGAVWVGTSDSGLFRYDGASFEKAPTSHPGINDLLEDREGNIWVGTSGGGLNRLRPRAVQLEEVEKSLPFESVTSLGEDTNHVLWAATQNGLLVRRTEGSWSTIGTNEGWPGGEASCVSADRFGAVWIGTRNRVLYRRQDEQFNRWDDKDGLVSRDVRGLLASSSGDVWIGGEVPKALQRLRDGQLSKFEVPAHARQIRAIVEDSAGDIWVGTSGGVLLRISHDVLTDETGRLPGELMSIRCLYATPDGSLWIGRATGGLGRLRNGKYTRITGAQGLYDDHISQIVADEQDSLWFGADHGIFKIRRAELEALAEGKAARVRCRHYGRDDGLQSLQANFDASPGAIRTRDGRLWLSMRTALAVINPGELHESPRPPEVLPRRLFVDERPVAEYGGVMPVPAATNLPLASGKLRLAPKHRVLEFEFTALNLSAPENVHFRYRLDGFDDDWIECGQQRKATYPQLPAGDYQFRVAACNSHGTWYESDAPLSFAVAPFLWQTWTFRVGTLVAFTVLIAGAVRYVSFRRLRWQLRMVEQQAALDKERARIARDLHDDLGGSLTQVSLLLDRAQRDLNAPERAGKGVQQCSTLVGQVVKSVDEIIWAINPRNDTLRYVIDYISQFVVEFLHAANIRCRVDLPDLIPEQTVSPEARHNLLLVVKETLNNIARHSHATEVRFRVTVTEGEVSITVEDNGQGFQGIPDNACADGLRNMRQRMEEIGGEFGIESRPREGTLAWVRLPIKLTTNGH
jgi:signal transduction histidine kinase/ligand-binding sensor domain-containing protein